MKKSAAQVVILSLTISGCSSIGSGWDNTVDFIFGSDDGAGQRQEAAAKMASNAAGSANQNRLWLIM